MTRLRLQLEGALQFLLAALVVWFGLAVSSIDVLNIPIARAVRWAVLAEVAGCAVLYAAIASRRLRVPATFVLAAIWLGIALLSAAWSPDPRLTLGRALTIVALFVAGGGLAIGSAAGSDGIRPFLLGILVGTAAIGVGGLIMLVADYGRAVVPATTGQGARYSGLGANPDTMALLFAVVLPIGLWALFEARARWEKVTAATVLVLLDASLAAAASRAMLVGAFVGAVVFVLAVPLRRRARLALVAIAVAVFAVNVVAGTLPPVAKHEPILHPEFGTTLPLGPHDAEARLPLEDEIGFPRKGHFKHRSLFDAGGRLPAWRGAVKQAAQRPLEGYGFGTEERVFVDRYYPFLSNRPENSYIGMLLQLGAVGLLAFLALLGRVVWEGVRVLPRLRPDQRPAGAACLAVVATGIVIAIAQSYIISVGSTATAPFWLCAFLLVGLAAVTP